MLRSLEDVLTKPGQVSGRALDRHAAAADASHFLLVPEAVVTPTDAAEVGALMRASAAQGVSLTFRSGGTSLSGQAVTDSVLVDVRKNFRDIEVLDEGARVRVRPGATVRQVNARLARHGRRLGPDPASEAACTIGGVVANNSSGMNCGITENTYQTLESMTLVLPSGTVIDTAAPDADGILRHHEPHLYRGLAQLADRVRSDSASVATVRRQFSMKNTMGYGLNALLDFDTPAQILAHLAIGSEGTLGFVAEAVFRTVVRPTHSATALLVFEELQAANEALPALVDSRAATVELLDATSLRVGQRLTGTPPIVRDLRVQDHAALLVEYSATTAEQLEELRQHGEALTGRIGLSQPAGFTTDADARAVLWHLRKGLYASVAGARPQGTTALLEDIVVPVPALGRTCTALTQLFDRYDYRDSVIFGHAKDGNVHFMLTDDFADPARLQRYSDFTEDMVDLVLGEGGSLKAEHGTGRVMAPYVRRQYGDELYGVMREIKQLCDPGGVLNPGVLLNDDPQAHLRHIKAEPSVAEEVDSCVSCGYCEPVCPSRDLTLTPRQRIVTLRAIRSARLAGDEALAQSLEEDYDYAAVQTCAVDGMCQTACPVEINTGDLVKRLRRQETGAVAQAGWNLAAQHWGTASIVAGRALDLAAKLPAAATITANQLVRRIAGADTVPLYSPELPRGGGRRRRPAPVGEPVAVYFPACVSAMFGPAQPGTGAPGAAGVQDSVLALAQRAGVELLVPSDIDALCCGTPWSSKGKHTGQETITARTIAALRRDSDHGRLPIVCDASSCTEGLRHALEVEVPPAGQQPLRILDAVEFTAEHLLPRLPEPRRIPSLTLHPTCSSTRMGLNPALARVAEAIAEDVQIPDDWGCCAFAGDRGLLHPELTASATARQAEQVQAIDASAHASCNRTCELGMSRATGYPYSHVLELLNQSTIAGG